MGGIIGSIQDLYIRLMVWMGAEPPEGYQHLIQEEILPTDYTLKDDDTIYSVARKFKVHYNLIAQANEIEDLNSVKPGQTLTIPRPDWKPDTEPEAETETPAEVEQVEEETPPSDVDQPESAPAEEAPPPSKDEEWLDVAEPTEPEKVEQLPLEEVPPVDQELVFRYEVQRGDTLNSIARKYGLTVKDLVDANEIDDASPIYPGQKLIIPGYMETKPETKPESEPIHHPIPETGQQFIYTVAAGDTLNSISKRYGITVREIIEANDDIEDPTKIKIGQKIVIPGVIATPEPMPETPPIAAPPVFETDPHFPPIGPLDAIRAMYVSYFAIGHPQARQHIFEMLDTTELNAVVIDAKGDHGFISYPTQVPLAQEIGANKPTIKDFQDVLAKLKKRNIYTIARVTTFKDTPLAKGYAELAVKTETGALWQDSEKSGWVDPFLKPVWDYNIQIAVEAAQMGFDEVQFDCVRFPTARRAGTPQFSQAITKASRVAATTGFLSMARGQLETLGVKIGARVLGYTCWRKDDSIVGQDIEKMAQYLDVLSPMLYPSTFHAGIPDYKFAIAHPYEVVFESAKRAVNRVQSAGCQVRPWIQDFPDYRFDKRVYGKDEIQAQIKGCFDSGSTGFMVWDPQIKYTSGAYAPLKQQV